MKLQKSIVKHRTRILAAIEHNLSNALIESTNTKIRLITRMAFGFKSPRLLSPWPCSASAATDQPCQAGNDPQVRQESPKLTGFHPSAPIVSQSDRIA